MVSYQLHEKLSTIELGLVEFGECTLTVFTRAVLNYTAALGAAALVLEDVNADYIKALGLTAPHVVF